MSGAGQGLVAFATGAFDRLDYAIKFFLSRPSFLAEVGLYQSESLGKLLPQVPPFAHVGDCGRLCCGCLASSPPRVVFVIVACNPDSTSHAWYFMLRYATLRCGILKQLMELYCRKLNISSEGT
jgi:hypothetical protein